MISFEGTDLWLRTLAPKPGDQFSQEREKLRAAFLSFRERAKLLAAEISRDLPDYTVHDVTHLDALWQLADLIAGQEYEITPTEAFVLGGAFLTHDLGNGLAAYPDGVEAMYASKTWSDALSLILRKRLGRAPTGTEIRCADESAKKAATAQSLRALHAQQAELLALVSWKDPNSGSQLFLIQDEFLRKNYGRLIGRIAHSHWWNVEKLKPEFDAPIGAPAGYPSTWTVDALKLACLLRVADASHLDASRAPVFLKAIRQPGADSLDHWSFQEKLQQPMRSGDRLIFSSAQPFKQTEAPSWWVCFDALQGLDRELSGADSMLADSSRPRLAVRGVQGAEDALRLTRWVATDGWAPVDTRIKASDVARLAGRLGGAQLYGKDQLVPLRELIQNAGDAIRARRYMEHRSEDYGEITVRLGSDDHGHWIEVADNGVGMSESVITGSLLDFGSPFWNSERMLQELPGLASTSFESTGRYGIGFFSLFMWGTRARVTSRRYEEGVSQTRILEFHSGLEARPILRDASPGEYLADGGTTVRVWVQAPPESQGGVLFRPRHKRRKVEEICQWLCPTIDTTISVQRGASSKKIVVKASDWKTMDGRKLLQRFADDTESSAWVVEEEKRLIELLGPKLRTITDEFGDVIGRAAVNPSELYSNLGAVTDGGLRACTLFRIAGVLRGAATTAARNAAIPSVDPNALAKWANGQQALVTAFEDEDAGEPDISRAACTIGYCGGDVGDLPIAENRKGWMSVKKLRTWSPLPNEIILLEKSELEMITQDLGPVDLEHNVLVCEGPRAYFVEGETDSGWPDPEMLDDQPFRGGSNMARVARLLAERWESSPDEVAAASTLSTRTHYEWRRVGKVGQTPIERSVHILRNPRRAVSGARTRRNIRSKAK